jgi:hypothetical protein
LIVAGAGGAVALVVPQSRKWLSARLGLGDSSSVRVIRESIEVGVPVSTAYNQWTQFEDFPLFMEGVDHVQQLDDASARSTSRGLGCANRRQARKERGPMLCFLTARKLKPGTFEDFRKAWEPQEWDPRFTRAYHVRNAEDENEVVSFGFFEGTMDDLRAKPMQRDAGRWDRMSVFVEEELVNGVYEVIDEVTPPGR